MFEEACRPHLETEVLQMAELFGRSFARLEAPAAVACDADLAELGAIVEEVLAASRSKALPLRESIRAASSIRELSCLRHEEALQVLRDFSHFFQNLDELAESSGMSSFEVFEEVMVVHTFTQRAAPINSVPLGRD
mmetsp:Transcript_12740/g.32100  ORF Transcript_12740/g.32100 Transcript_12740/m.32100 type:complete len:136 (+) Transcript_12740:109-516(+)